MRHQQRLAMLAYIDIEYGMGATRRVCMIADGFRKAGLEVSLLGAVGKVPPRAKGDLAESHSAVEIPSVGKRISFAARRRCNAMVSLRHILREGLDWLYLYNLGADGIPFALAAMSFGCSIVTDTCDVRHGGSILAPRQLLEGISYSFGNNVQWRCADLNVVVSRYLRDSVRKTAPAVPTHMLPALIDTDAFRHSEERRSRFRKDWALGSAPLIAYLGGSQRFEGLADLIEACSLLREKRVEFRLLIAGEMLRGPFHDYLPDLVRNHHLESTVLLTGRLSTDGVMSALSAADILVVPKRLDRANVAGFPQKLAECLAAGKPVVATKVGDVPLYLEDGESAILCEPNSPDALSAAIVRILETPELAAVLGRNARELSIRCFDSDSQTAQLAERMESIRENRTVRLP